MSAPDFAIACHVEWELESADTRPLTDRAAARLVAASLHEAGAGDGEQLEVSVTFVEPGAMRKLNAEHRDVNRPTDVLAFPIDGLVEPIGSGEPRVVGDIVVCPAYVMLQLQSGTTMVPHGPGQEAGDATLVAALERCIVHGTLHLAGFDHERGEVHAEEMVALEQLVLDRVRGAGADPTP